MLSKKSVQKNAHFVAEIEIYILVQLEKKTRHCILEWQDILHLEEKERISYIVAIVFLVGR